MGVVRDFQRRELLELSNGLLKNEFIYYFCYLSNSLMRTDLCSGSEPSSFWDPRPSALDALGVFPVLCMGPWSPLGGGQQGSQERKGVMPLAEISPP